MISKIKIFYLFIIFIFSFFVFNSVFAAGLVPCGGCKVFDKSTGKCIVEEPPCTFCHLLELGQNVINFLIKIAIPFGVIFIVYGGIMMMITGGSAEKLKQSKDIILSAVIGVVIVLTSWVILNTFFHLMTGQLNWPWSQIQC